MEAVADAPAATAKITTPDADEDMDGHQVALTSAPTRSMATVTAQDGSTEDYTLTVTRAAAPASLSARMRSMLTEGDDVSTYMVSLATKPMADVTVTITATDGDDS